MKTAIFQTIIVNDRTMSTAYILLIGGGQVDRSCRGRAVEADSTAVVRECTMREDAKSGIKKSISKRKNCVLARNLDGEDSEFYEEAASSSSDEESFPNTWLTEDSEIVEMAALVSLRLRSDMMDICGMSAFISISCSTREWAKSG